MTGVCFLSGVGIFYLLLYTGLLWYPADLQSNGCQGLFSWQSRCCSQCFIGLLGI